MEKLPVAGGLLDAMAHRVAEIQQRALAVVSRSSAATMRALIATLRPMRSASPSLRGIEDVEHPGIANRGVLDDLCDTFVELPIRQRAQSGGVREHERGMMKRSNEILAAGRVHARLATHGAIDLRNNRRGHLHVGNAAVVDRRDEAREVAHHAAAERDEHRLAIQAGGDHCVDHLRDDFHALRGLASLDDDERGLEPRVAQRLHHDIP